MTLGGWLWSADLLEYSWDISENFDYSVGVNMAYNKRIFIS